MVICFGSLLLDRVLRVPRLPLPGEGLHATEERWFVGGEACHVGRHLAAWGERVTIAGNRLGDDEAGSFVRAELEGGALIELLTTIDPAVRTPTCTVLLTPDGERTMVVSWPTETGYLLPDQETLRAAQLVSASIYGPGMDELLELAREHHIPLALADITGSEDQRLPGACLVTTSRSQLARHGVEDIEHWIDAVHTASGAFVAVSDGPRPVLAVDRQGRRWSAQPPQLEPVDTTGAGDALKAGLIYARLQGYDSEQALQYAVAIAGLQCRGVGPYIGFSREHVHRRARSVEVRQL